MLTGNTLSIGRNFRTADVVSVTNFGDCARLDLRWHDGAHAYFIFDTKQEAVEQAASLGFYPN